MNHRVEKLIADVEAVRAELAQLSTAYEQTGQNVAARDFLDIRAGLADAITVYQKSIADIRYCRHCAKDSDHSNLPCTPGGPHEFEARDERKKRIVRSTIDHYTKD